MLLVPYSNWNLNPCVTDTYSPYLDLLFGDLPVCCWTLVALSQITRHADVSTGKGLTRAAIHIVLFGCVYWGMRFVENIVDIVAPNLADAECKSLGVKQYYVPLVYAILASGITLLIARTDLFHIGTLFGAPGRNVRYRDSG